MTATKSDGAQAQCNASSETQGQLVGAGKSQNGRKKIRAKKSQEGEEEPLGTRSAFHLVKNSENSGSGLNGKRFFGSPDWKIPRKSGTAQKVVPFSRLERPNGNLCSIYRISRLYTSSMPFAVF